MKDSSILINILSLLPSLCRSLVVNNTHRTRGVVLLIVTALFLSGCGGGGGDSSNPFTGSGWKEGVFADASEFANQCEAPREGRSPVTGRTYPDRNGSYKDENNFLRSWSNDTYLWYSEIIDRNPASYSNTLEYFALLKTNAKTQSGKDKDQFHFTYNTDEYDALSQSGATYGYGLNLVWTENDTVITVAYTEPGSPAAFANIPRGSRILEVDGIVVAEVNSNTQFKKLIATLYPSSVGAAYEFVIQEPDSETPRTLTLQSANVTIAPVQSVKTITTENGTVGYLLFNDHTLTAEQALIDAVDYLDSVGIDDLVVDLRYNGGGYLDIASEFGYMIAGASATQGKTFEKLQFNDKHPTRDPVTGERLVPIPFHNTAVFQDNPQMLPTLSLNRVFVLTGDNTCSASEALINGLRGVDVSVVQIGGTTCGKPYGFYPQPNCGTTYFSVQFRGVNAKNFGDYSDGFVPSNSDNGQANVRGCSIADDFTHDLGDENEARLAAALYFRENNTCPSANVSLGLMMKPGVVNSVHDGLMRKEPALQNKLMRQ